MTVGILLITHENVGQALLDNASATLGMCPLASESVCVSRACEPDLMRQHAQQLCNDLDQGHGVLILTDMYGSTPSNIACSLKGDNTRVISGINLPMLIRVFNYPSLSLDELAEKALSGGREGILECQH
jgi:PTS system ascorbate-specific IIA component